MNPESPHSRRRAAQLAARARAHLMPVPDEKSVAALLDQLATASSPQPASIWDADLAAEPDPARADEALSQIRRGLDEKRLEALLVASRRSTIDAIVRPFGIGRLVARMDRRGGPVLTLHNARTAREEGWPDDFADPNRLSAFKERVETPYQRSDYEPEDWPERKEAAWDRSGGKDAYTGEQLSPARGADLPQGNVDHVVPIAEVHRDDRVAFHLSKDQAVAAVNSPSNLAVTEDSLNKSKNSTPLQEWADKTGTGDSGQTNAEKYGLDRERADEVDAQARAEIDRELRFEAAKQYAQATATAAASEALHVGLYQALGLLLVELAEALYDETVRFLGAEKEPGGGGGGTLLQRLGQALRRVAERVVGQWKECVAAFRDGALSGLLSTIVTVVVNAFYTTAKRVVRIIREGVFSAGRALRMVIAPPAGMTAAEAAHECSKLVAGALVIAGGIGVEDAVEKALLTVPVLGAFASPLTTVIVGLGAGLGTVLLCYLIDQVDVFGVRRDAAHRETTKLLTADIEGSIAELEAGLMSLTASA